MNITKGAIDKVASRKLAATAAAATWTIELTRPVAALAVAYIAGQGGVPIPIRTVSPSASWPQPLALTRTSQPRSE
jgi:hypothetical protein